MHPFYDQASFEPERSIGYLLKRLSKLSSAQIEASFAGSDLTLTHWIALAMLHHRQADTGADLARWIGHDSGATTRLIDGLESRGLVERRRCPDDRRVVRLAVTPEGLRRFDALTPLLLEVWNEALADFRHDEVETLIAMLGRLVAAFEARVPNLPGIVA